MNICPVNVFFLEPVVRFMSPMKLLLAHLTSLKRCFNSSAAAAYVGGVLFMKSVYTELTPSGLFTLKMLFGSG